MAWSGIVRVAAVAAAVLVAGVIPAAAQDGVIEGTVVYRERMLLPAGAEVRIVLEDVSLADAPAPVIAETTISGRTSPIPFSLSYAAEALVAGHSYAIRATISRSGRLLYTTDERHAFDPDSADPVELLVRRTAPAVEPEPPAIVGEWLAEDIGGAGVIDDVQSTLTVASDGTVSGRGACNRYRGQATIAGDRIAFGALAATLMACPEAVSDQERRFFDALGRTSSFQRDAEGRLILLDAEGAELVRFSAL